MRNRALEEENSLISELCEQPRHREKFPDCLEFGCSWVDLTHAAVLLSPCVWYPARSIADSTFAGGQYIKARELKYVRRLMGKDGRVFVKYAIDGNGEELHELFRQFLITQLRIDRRTNSYQQTVDRLIGIYLDAKEDSRKRLQTLSRLGGNDQQVNIISGGK
jgi:hypothetical protein